MSRKLTITASAAAAIGALMSASVASAATVTDTFTVSGTIVADCVILDISAGGAKVKFDKPLGDAEGVNLSLGQRLKIAAAIDFPVEVVWQDGSVAGLRFLNDPYEVAGALEELLPPECVRFDDVERVGE